MDFAFDSRTEELRSRLTTFLDEYVLPAESVYEQQVAERDTPWTRPPVVEELKCRAREQGLWNLFLPRGHGLPYAVGAGLGTAQYAPLAEITGRSPHLAPEALNCAAPDTGNIELLAEFGSEAQRERWLKPLLDGRIRSAFCMSEPDVASSDATNIATRIRPEGDGYRIDGHKWWSTGALAPECAFLVVMGKTDPDAERHGQQSMVLVERDAPGVDVRRGMRAFGYDDGPRGGHAEVVFDGVHVPAENLIGTEGSGFAIAQARLGPGRVHHCMRLIGAAERALELMCRRVTSRVAFSRPLAEQGVVQEWIAESRVRIEAARLLVLKAAWLMDTVGNKGAHSEIQEIKILVPRTVEWVIDRAIQAHGAAGMSQDLPLAELWASARALRFADGPDEVHQRSLARRELRAYRGNRSGVGNTTSGT